MTRLIPLDEPRRDAADPVERAAQVLSEPLPATEPELSREIARRSEKVEQIFNEHALAAVRG
jgi:hypothetical protein